MNKQQMVTNQGGGWVGIRAEPLPLTVHASRGGVKMYVGDEQTRLDTESAAALVGVLGWGIGLEPIWTPHGFGIIASRPDADGDASGERLVTAVRTPGGIALNIQTMLGIDHMHLRVDDARDLAREILAQAEREGP